MATDFFGLASIFEGGSQKVTQFVTLLTNLVKILSFEPIPITVTGSNVTLTSTQEQSGGRIVASGASTGARQVIVSNTKRLWIFSNTTTGGFSHTVKTAAGTGVAVAGSTHKLLYCDGTNVISIT